MKLGGRQCCVVVCLIASSGCGPRSAPSEPSRSDPVPKATERAEGTKPSAKAASAEEAPPPKPVFDPRHFEVKKITSGEQFTETYNVFAMLYLGSDKTSHYLIHRYSDTVYFFDRTELPDRQLVAQYEDKKKNRDPDLLGRMPPNHKRSEQFLKWYHEIEPTLTRVPGINEDDDW